MVGHFDFVLYRMVRGFLIYKVVLEQRHGRSEGVSHADISVMISLGKGISSAKALGGSLQNSRNNKETRVTEAE